MLNKYDKENIANIKMIASKVFGKNCEFDELKILDRPFTEFEWSMRLYGQFEIVMKYDRSILDIAVKTSQGEKWLTDLTNEKIVEGFESCKKESLASNFMLLDEVVRQHLI